MRYAIIVSVILLASCANPEKDWELASRDDSTETYLEYLAKYPDSAQAALARERMQELKVIRAWERAEFKDTIAAYQAFDDKYGDSEYAAAAREHVREFQRDEHWEKVLADGSKQMVEAFLKEYPDAPQLAEAQSMLTAMAEAEEAARPKERPGNFRLQLAAFKTAIAAEQELRRLVALAPETLLGPVRIESPNQDSVSNMFLLKSVPMTGVEARDACAALKKIGQDCLIINR